MARADFTGADFTGADFTGAAMEKAELGRALLNDAVLDGASLKGTDLTGAYTYLAHFEATDLSAAKGLTQMQLDAACGDDKTILPPGLTAPDSWPCGQE